MFMLMNDFTVNVLFECDFCKTLWQVSDQLHQVPKTSVRKNLSISRSTACTIKPGRGALPPLFQAEARKLIPTPDTFDSPS